MPVLVGELVDIALQVLRLILRWVPLFNSLRMGVAQNEFAAFRRCAQALRTGTSIAPIPSTVQCITSPASTGPTPSGVPVMMTSPGCRV